MKKLKFIVVLTLGLVCATLAYVYPSQSTIQRNRIENTSLFWVSKQENQNGKPVKINNCQGCPYRRMPYTSRLTVAANIAIPPAVSPIQANGTAARMVVMGFCGYSWSKITWQAAYGSPPDSNALAPQSGK